MSARSRTASSTLPATEPGSSRSLRRTAASCGIRLRQSPQGDSDRRRHDLRCHRGARWARCAARFRRRRALGTSDSGRRCRDGRSCSGGLAFTTNGLGAIQAYGDRRRLRSPARADRPIEPSTPPNPFTVRGTLTPAKTGLDRVADLDIGPDGNLYVVDFRPRVSVISPTGEIHPGLGTLRRW